MDPVSEDEKLAEGEHPENQEVGSKKPLSQRAKSINRGLEKNGVKKAKNKPIFCITFL